MKTKTQRHRICSTKAASTLMVLAALHAVGVPAFAHHSFAAYNMEVTKVYTGVVTRVNPDANHLQVFFAPMNDERKNVIRGSDGKPVIMAVEMAGSAQAAKDGVSVNSFPPGTIFSVALHPLRDGQSAGTRGPNGAIYKCPVKTPPAPGKHCDSVKGRTVIGTGALPTIDVAPTTTETTTAATIPAAKPATK